MASAILHPTVCVNQFGVKAFPPNIGDELVGRTVAVRDWYGEASFLCVGVVFGANGYPCALEHDRGVFSIHSAREIEVI